MIFACFQPNRLVRNEPLAFFLDFFGLVRRGLHFTRVRPARLQADRDGDFVFLTIVFLQ